MSPRRTRRGTIREGISEISVDNILKSTSKKLRNTRNASKNVSIKTSEQNGDSLIEGNNIVDNVTSINCINDTLTNLTKRRKKEQKILDNQENSILSVKTEESKCKTRTKGNNVKSSNFEIENNIKSQVIGANSLISDDESFNMKKQKSDKSVSYNLSNLSEDENLVIKKKRKSDTHDSLLDRNECKTPETVAKSSLSIVSLTPHHSKKTPRRSPINLGSPKTHSRNSLKLLNVPRKLSITDSPPSSEKSNNSLQQLSSSNNENKSTGKKNKNFNSSKSVLKLLSSKKSTSPTLKVRPRFSKSPKIVLKTPKSKSSKSNKRSSSHRSSLTATVENSIKNEFPSRLKKLPKANASLKSNKSLSNSNEETSHIVSPTNPSISFEDKSILKFENELQSVTESSSELNSSLQSEKVSKTASPKKTPKLPHMNSSLKSKNLSQVRSPKFVSPLNSRKMPKIVLSLKSKKSPLKSSKNTSLTKSSKSKTPSPSKLKKVSGSVSPSKKERTPMKLSTRKSIVNNNVSLENATLSPRVIVSKLSTLQLKKSTLTAKENQPCINLIPVDHIVQSSMEKADSMDKSKNSKSIKFSIKQQSLNSSDLKTLADTSKYYNTSSDVLEGKLLNIKPADTSTPREKTKRTSRVKIDKEDYSSSKQPNNFIELNGTLISKSRNVKQSNNQLEVSTNHQLLEDESEPTMNNNSSLMHLSDVFDSDNSQMNKTFEINKSDRTSSIKNRSAKDLNILQETDKDSISENKKNCSNASNKEKSFNDDTYEVEFPKTPKFQKQSNKRKSDEAELSIDEHKTKKNCKVQFASPVLKKQMQSSGFNRIGTPGHAIQKKRTSVSANVSKTPIKSVNESIVNKIQRKRINSLPSSQIKTPINSSVTKRQSSSFSNINLRLRKNNHETQANHLGQLDAVIVKEKKSETKTPLVKKIPNFAEIHQKNFAKMESIIDLKKRVEKRHIILNSTTASTKKTPSLRHQNGNNKPAPPDSNSAYNRFGFKMRKNEAVNLISKKQTNNIESREKKREDARSALKGVRMNRRFELQMKSRLKTS